MPKDGAIITQGEDYQRIYQISRGQCRIEVRSQPARNHRLSPYPRTDKQGREAVGAAWAHGEGRDLWRDQLPAAGWPLPRSRAVDWRLTRSQGNGASASVLADTDDGVDLTIIEGYFINAVFNINPGFAGRFFRCVPLLCSLAVLCLQLLTCRYLAILIAHRVRERRK